MKLVSRVCQKCGTEIPADAPEGGCPGCLLETALDAAGGQIVFGRYNLVKVLGRGGMGIVWLARDQELERDVALKFLPDLMIQDRTLLDQLKRETKRCLELTHSHIVRIHDFIHDERSGCISMEYVDGETLSNLRAAKEQKVFEPPEIAAWITQLCDALDYAHNRARVIHRDLKPANLMVNQRGDLKVADFGIARSLADSASRLTAEQGRSGTLVYMSPQQLSGDRGTHLDDIYSLGASIYELLTSKPPFYSGNIDRQICERIALSMTERRKELDIEPALVPQVWEDAVAACLAKDPSRRPQSAVEVAQRLQLPSGQTRGTTTFGKPSKRKALVLAAIAMLSILGLAGVYFGGSKQRAAPVSRPPATPEKSIAVLPFENLSKDEENAFFALGVQEEILNDLAKVAALKVISRTSVAQYKNGPERNLREIANQLGVSHILEGSVQRVGNRVRVSAQLIDANLDSHVWGEHYDRDVADIFALESELAQKIVAQLQTKLSPAEKAALQEQPTANLAAYDRYLKAKVLLGITTFSTRARENLLAALQLLDEAVALDPAFFLAYYQIAVVNDRMYSLGLDRTPKRLALGDAAIQQMVRLRPDAGETHLARAQHFYRGYLDYDHARQELVLASATLPNEPAVYEITGYIDRRQGLWEESIRDLERALELDPRNLFTLQQLSLTYQKLRRFADETAILDRALTFAPADVDIRVARAQVDLEWRADLRPLHNTIDKLVRENPALGQEIDEPWMLLALCERDPATMARALSSVPPEGINENGTTFPRAWSEGLAARVRGDAAASRTAFASARNELMEMIKAQPNYARALAVLGMTDAALGHRDDALRESLRAVELLPISQDAVNGASHLRYLAITYTWLGEKDLAIDELSKAAKIPSDVTYGQLRLHPYWDSLRGDPRFEKVVASLAPK